MKYQIYKDNDLLSIKNIEEIYEIEENFLQELSSGDFSKAMDAYEIFTSVKPDGRSGDSFHDAYYLAIVLGTLCRKTLQYRNKVHPYYLDSISREMSIELFNTKTINDINAVIRKYIKKYCLLARNHSLHQYTEIVNKTVSYIELNYTDELSLSSLAGHFHVNKNYLSAVFKKQIGKTVTEYIHDIRLDKAIFFLNTTKLPIHNIAMLCGYTDSNYFCRIFKNQHKISPGQYRNKLLQQ